MAGDEIDPALTEDLENLFARNDVRALPGTGRWTPSAHTRAVKSVVEACQKLPGWKRVRKRPVGKFILCDDGGRPRKKPGGGYITVQVAVKGDPDVEMSYAPPEREGRLPISVAFEIKTGAGRLSVEQMDKKTHLESGGWIYIVTSGGVDAISKLKEALLRI